MEIRLLHSKYTLENKPRQYYLIFHDIRGNYLQPMLGYIQLYEMKKDAKYIILIKNSGKKTSIRFIETITNILNIMKKQGIKGRLLSLIKTLKSEANFDWTNINKFKEFKKKYDEILTILKNLP